MGCDIHMFVEYKRGSSWFAFGDRINPGRNYNVFARLCGVRNHLGVEPISEPRGLPSDVSFTTKSQNILWVDDTSSSDNCVDKATAQRWVDMGHSEWEDFNKKVTNPDWHSHSWATAYELAEVLSQVQDADVEWHVILAILRKLEEEGHESRIVFWFDN